ncbi:RICIN domain-containing protein [Amycolatopsis sp. NPDC059027]|uniref:RICIN domain-containing protein n=1 Tax=Amycolatopsis sp. NPDC059027 TaxID=3346709 RepID=UPI00366C4FD3
MKIVRALLLVPVAAMLATVGLAASASAEEAGISDAVNRFENAKSHWCIDDSIPAGLRTFGCNTLKFQQFNVHVWNDKTRQLKNLATGRCLDDSDQFGLRTLACWPGGNPNSKYQSWVVTKSGKYLRFQNQATKRCLTDIGGGKLVTRPCSADDTQKWS